MKGYRQWAIANRPAKNTGIGIHESSVCLHADARLQ